MEKLLSLCAHSSLLIFNSQVIITVLFLLVNLLPSSSAPILLGCSPYLRLEGHWQLTAPVDLRQRDVGKGVALPW